MTGASPYVAAKLELQRLAEARARVAHQLQAIDRQILARAEILAIETIGGSARPYHRSHASKWRLTHERAYRAHAAHLRDTRAAEIRALARKHDRQTAAIDAFRRRHGLNIDAAELLGRNLRLEIEEG